MLRIIAAFALIALAGCDRSRDLIVDADGPWAGGYFDRMGSHFLTGPAGETRIPVRKRGNVCFFIASDDSVSYLRVSMEGDASVTGVDLFPPITEGPQAIGCFQ